MAAVNSVGVLSAHVIHCACLCESVSLLGRYRRVILGVAWDGCKARVAKDGSRKGSSIQ